MTNFSAQCRQYDTPLRKCRALLLAVILVAATPASLIAFGDPTFEELRQGIIDQPSTFENTAIFTVHRGYVVRADRFTLISGVLGDFDGDGDVDHIDYRAAQICHNASGPGIATPPACDVFDFNGDVEIDLVDMAAFMGAFTGPLVGVVVEAGGLVPILTPDGLYYSGLPGTNGNNALNGIAAQAGYVQEDLWYAWTVVLQPPDSGEIVMANASFPATAYTMLASVQLGDYVFKLTVTNLVTLESDEDIVALSVVECLADSTCDDFDVCTIDSCSPTTGCAFVPVECPLGESCHPATGLCGPACSTDAECPQNSDFCDGLEFCNTETRRCVSTGDPCLTPLTCSEATQTCEGDLDGDGVIDSVDNCPNVFNDDQTDTDGDGIGDACEIDQDSDGVEDGLDNCPVVPNAAQSDADNDAVGDVCDNCVNASNTDQADADNDGVGDVCALDSDSDGIDNSIDNCLTVSNANQADGDNDTVGDACDNCINVANTDQANSDTDNFGNACDNCDDNNNNDQADADGDGIGDVCDTTPGNQTVTITPGGRKTYPCETIQLSAVSTEASATLTWTQTAGPDAALVASGATATITTPTDARQSTLTFTATATATNFNNGQSSVSFTVDNASVATQTSGDAQPGETVTLQFADLVPAAFAASAAWSSDAANSQMIAVSTTTNGIATFVAPTVTTTTDFTFTVAASNACSGVALSGTATVSVQVASAVFDLPATITIGTPIDLDDFLALTGQPARDVTIVFSLSSNGDLPPGVEVSLDANNFLSATAGAGETIAVTVQVFGTSGQLVEISDTIMIVAP